MRKEIKKAPTIRFQGFTDEWEQRKLGELAGKTYGGGTPRTSEKTFWNGQVPWFQSSDLIEDKVLSAIPKKKITEKGLQKSAAQLIPENSIAIITRVGVGKLAFIPFSYSTSQDFLSLSALNIDGKFGCYSIYKLLQREKNLTQGTSIKGITKKELLRKILWIPCQDEQIKIGRYIANIDNLITLHQRKLDQLKTLKKYFLQNMFPAKGEKVPRIRFKGFTGDWEQRKLGELATFNKGAGYSKSDLKASGTQIILYGRLYTKYETVIKQVDTFVDSRPGSIYSEGGEVIVPASGETAEDIAIASVVEKPGILLGGDLNIIHPIRNLDSTFLAISISNGEPHKEMAKRAQGKSVVHLHNDDLSQIKFRYPSIEEQSKISKFFSNLDNLITLHQRKLDQLQTMKKFMLQNMFI